MLLIFCYDTSFIKLKSNEATYVTRIHQNKAIFLAIDKIFVSNFSDKNYNNNKKITLQVLCNLFVYFI